ncbi:hypothetical protein B9Z55_009793 [Caenorhabditis nigoni]|uniref:Uncharacterized protein n=1 Tax=Caenorhabditis nigoni TaxID=1611254 RepID=A0A2G5UTJ0_9PELO|nr:hypothetical protein B9Z55_009793 [Caenorhabditis nigoni]
MRSARCKVVIVADVFVCMGMCVNREKKTASVVFGPFPLSFFHSFTIAPCVEADAFFRLLLLLFSMAPTNKKEEVSF